MAVMSLTETTPVTRPGDPQLAEPPNRNAHIVHDLDRVAAAIIEKTPLTALCGYVFVPEQSPRDKPVCQACKDVWNEIKGGLGDGSGDNNIYESWED